MVVIRIQYLDKITGKVFLLHCLLIITAVKGRQLKLLLRLRIPDNQGIHNIVSISHNRHVIGNCKHGLVVYLLKMQLAVVMLPLLHMASEFYFIAVLRPAQLKRIAVL